MATGRIPDTALTSSSVYGRQYSPRYGRLYGLSRDGSAGAWSPRQNYVGEWLQIDLGTVTVVTGIATQGQATHWREQWVTQYGLSYSVNGVTFERYENNKVCNTQTFHKKQ